ncbi:hypothetical protein QBC32DRAFT_327143 [Pseudoneurospora amorphoporcata]|uniref:Uncharacterized protein n=1 Tax=Pseudoneurospora amorphoporcata TaxID=241081 RepID=A0AAN6SDJ9_9PEZI|nr:hypothetical protein QBC32DRAFT_327143 [Pseudoneurospora amorphoporcata]
MYSAIVTNADFAKCLPRCPVFDPPLIATATSQAPAVQLVWQERDRRNIMSGGTDRNMNTESETGSGNTAPRTTAASTAISISTSPPPSSESTDQISTGSGSKSSSGLTPPTGRNVVLIVVLSVGIPLLLFLAGGCFGIRWYRRRKRAQEQRRDQDQEELRLAEELDIITYYNNEKGQGQGQNPSIQQPQPQQPLPLPAASKVVPEIEIAAHNDRPACESKAELDAIHTARARTARHPSENFADPRVELDAVATARARAVDEEARGKRRTWERQELDGEGGVRGSGSGAGGFDVEK